MTGVVDPAVDSEASAHALCGALTCQELRVRDIKFRGFDGDIGESFVGFCGRHVAEIQMAFVNGTARATAMLLLGIEPPEDGDRGA